MNNKEYKIALHAFYFGKWPEWIELYIETLRINETIDFYIFTDCETAFEIPKNVFIQKNTFQEYVKLISVQLNIPLEYNNPIKLCDLRPLLGKIHRNLFKQYDFYGWCDLDLLFGDIKSFCTNDILKRFEVFSTHEMRITGHFSLFKNNHKNQNLYKYIYKWEEKIKVPDFIGLDEHGITNALTMTFFDKLNEKMGWEIDNFATRWLSSYKKRKLYMIEQYTTPFTPIPWLDGSVNSQQPNEWYYKDGKITNSRDGDRNFIYLHFMNFKNSQWRHDGTKAPWEGKERICFATVKDMINGIVINESGIKSKE